MLLDAWTGPLACAALGVVRPWLAARGADAAGTARWLAFFLCALVLVGPLACLPAWVWLRYEAMAAALALLGASDARGAAAVLDRYLAPALAPLDAAVARLRAADADAVCEALERTFAAARAAEPDDEPDATTPGSDDAPGASPPTSDDGVVVQ
jgi:hypothetical protein